MAQTKKKSAAKSKRVAKKPTRPVKKGTKKLKAAKAPAKKSAASRLTASQMKRPSSATIPSKKAAPLLKNMITPLDDRIIVAVEEAPEKTAGGIIIPGAAAERPSRGTVLAMGRGRRNKKGVIRPLDVNVGDVVLFPQYAGQKIEIGSGEFLILREEELLAVSIA